MRRPRALARRSARARDWPADPTAGLCAGAAPSHDQAPAGASAAPGKPAVSAAADDRLCSARCRRAHDRNCNEAIAEGVRLAGRRPGEPGHQEASRVGAGRAHEIRRRARPQERSIQGHQSRHAGSLRPMNGTLSQISTPAAKRPSVRLPKTAHLQGIWRAGEGTRTPDLSLTSTRGSVSSQVPAGLNDG